MQSAIIGNSNLLAIHNKEAIQAAIAVMMVLKDTDVGPWSAATASLRKLPRQRYGELALEKMSFNWNVQNRYIEVLNFEMEVTHILETKLFELTDEEKVQVI